MEEALVLLAAGGVIPVKGYLQQIGVWQSQAAPWGPRELQDSQVPELHRLFPQLHHNGVSVPRESIQELLHRGCLSPVSC